MSDSAREVVRAMKVATIGGTVDGEFLATCLEAFAVSRCSSLQARADALADAVEHHRKIYQMHGGGALLCGQAWDRVTAELAAYRRESEGEKT